MFVFVCDLGYDKTYFLLQFMIKYFYKLYIRAPGE